MMQKKRWNAALTLPFTEEFKELYLHIEIFRIVVTNADTLFNSKPCSKTCQSSAGTSSKTGLKLSLRISLSKIKRNVESVKRTSICLLEQEFSLLMEEENASKGLQSCAVLDIQKPQPQQGFNNNSQESRTTAGSCLIISNYHFKQKYCQNVCAKSANGSYIAALLFCTLVT